MIEIWFADEARIRQKNKITRRWAKRGTRPSRRAAPQSGWLAHVGAAQSPVQHHAASTVTQMPRAQSRCEPLAVHARQMAVQQDLQILRGHSPPLLFRLEQVHRPTLGRHVHRPQRLDPRVVINAGWYNRNASAKVAQARQHQ